MLMSLAVRKDTRLSLTYPTASMESRREGLETKLPNVKISYCHVSQEAFENENKDKYLGRL